MALLAIHTLTFIYILYLFLYIFCPLHLPDIPKVDSTKTLHLSSWVYAALVAMKIFSRKFQKKFEGIPQNNFSETTNVQNFNIFSETFRANFD